MGEAAPSAQENIDAPAREAASPSCLCRILRAFESHEVRLWLVNGDGEVAALQSELPGEQIRDVPCSCIPGQMHGTGDQAHA